MLLTFALKNAEKLINYYLNLDPEARHRLTALSGKVLKIEITSLSINFYIKITAQGIQLIQHYADVADTIIRGTPLALLSLLQQNSENSHALLQNQNITIIGNLHVAQDIKNIFSEMEIDWEEYLSKICGDPLSHIISTQFRKLAEWSKATHKSLQRNIDEYIHEEINLFPAHLACSDLYSDIDKLRDDVERLSLRVNRLQDNTASITHE